MSGIHIVCPILPIHQSRASQQVGREAQLRRCQHPLFTGEPIELTTATVENITDLKRVEQALNSMRLQREELASRSRYALPIPSSSDGTSHFPYASAKIRKYTGLHRRMLLKMPRLCSRRSILKTATVCMKPYRRRDSHSRFGMTSCRCSFQTVG